MSPKKQKFQFYCHRIQEMRSHSLHQMTKLDFGRANLDKWVILKYWHYSNTRCSAVSHHQWTPARYPFLWWTALSILDWDSHTSCTPCGSWAQQACTGLSWCTYPLLLCAESQEGENSAHTRIELIRNIMCFLAVPHFENIQIDIVHLVLLCCYVIAISSIQSFVNDGGPAGECLSAANISTIHLWNFGQSWISSYCRVISPLDIRPCAQHVGLLTALQIDAA